MPHSTHQLRSAHPRLSQRLLFASGSAAALGVLVWGESAKGQVEATPCTYPATAASPAASCTLAPTVPAALAVGAGLTASGGGQIIADGVTVSLGAANTTGALAQAGGSIRMTPGTVRATSVGAAANGQIGLRATGANARIDAGGAAITLAPASGTTNNLTGVLAEGGGVVSAPGAVVQVGGGGNGVGSVGLRATGASSMIEMAGGQVSTASRGAFGATVDDGGVIALSAGAQVRTTGAQTTGTGPVGSHALFANGGGQISLTDGSASTSGALASAAYASGGEVVVTRSSLGTTGAGTTTEPAAALRVSGGGVGRVSGAGGMITASGQFGHGISVAGAGSQAIVSDTGISVTGTRAIGVSVLAGGAASLTASSVLATNSVGVDSVGGVVSLTDSSVRTTAATGHALRATAGSTVTLSGGSVRSEGVNANALFTGGSTLTATNVAVTTTGGGSAMGALADGASRLELVGGSVTTTGDHELNTDRRSHGLAARNPGGTLIARGTAATPLPVLTTGSEAMGAVADDGGSMSLADVAIRTEGRLALGMFAVVEQVGGQFIAGIVADRTTVTTAGLDAYGAMAQQNFLEAPATVVLNDSRIATSGERGVGLRAVSAGTVTATRSPVTTSGLNAHGALARDTPSSVNLNQTTVAASGPNAHGAVAQNGGLITGAGASVAASGTAASALFAIGAPAFPSRATFTASTLSNASGPAIGVAAAGDVGLTDSTVTSGSGEWLRVATPAAFAPLSTPEPPLGGVADQTLDQTPPAVDLPDLPADPPLTSPPEPPSAPAAPPTPAPDPTTAGLANITLTGSTVTGSAFTAPGSVSNVVMRGDSRWNLTGDSNLTFLLNDPSLIQFSPPQGGVFKTLTVVNYVGEDGQIGLNTVLESDGAPSDLLVIDGGTATGATGVIIDNAGGRGALTRADGILVVDAIAGGTTAPGAFSLARPVVAGPYEYLLFRGGASGSDDWFLRSALIPVPPEPPPPEPPGPTPPTPEPEPEPLIPLVRQEVSLITALPAMATLYGLTLIDTRHERVGEEEHLRSRLDIPGDRLADGAWGRVIAHHGERDTGLRGIYGDGPSFKYDFLALQAGMDVRRQEHDDGGWDQAGFYLAVGHGEADVEHGLIDRAFQAGDDKFDSVALGGYWTWFTENGLWWDAVVQGAWYDFVSRSGRFAKIEADGFGLALSFEIAKPFEVRDDDPNLVIEPQAQLVYQTLDLDDIHEPAADIRFSDTDSLAGRIGVRVAQTWTYDPDDEAPRLRTGWARFDLWKQFRGDPVTEYSSAGGFVPFHANLEDEWWRLGGGITAQTNRATSVFASATYNRAFNGDSHGWDLKLGARVEW